MEQALASLQTLIRDKQLLDDLNIAAKRVSADLEAIELDVLRIAEGVNDDKVNTPQLPHSDHPSLDWNSQALV
jgi:hypothetical protein